MGTEYDVERNSSPGGTQPHSLPKRCVVEQGGDALGGSALGAQSTITQMGHSDSPGSGRIVRDVLFEKSPYMLACNGGIHDTARLDSMFSRCRTCGMCGSPHNGLRADLRAGNSEDGSRRSSAFWA